MKICLIAPTYLPARRANTIQVMKMAQAMTALGHEVLVTVPGKSPEGHAPDWNKLANQYGLQHQFRVDWLPVYSWMRRYDYGYQAVKYARANNADLIYTRLPQAAGLASFLKFPTIFELHNFPQARRFQFLLKLFLKGSGARRLVLITHALRDDLFPMIDSYISNIDTIVAPDGVDLERYLDIPPPAVARNQLSLQERFTVGYTGHLYPGRGVELILMLATRLPEINFLLVGGNPDDVASLRTEAENANLKNVHLTGFVPNAELARYQAASDILLMPYQRKVAASSGGDISRYLSPMKLFEYMASERPIISSDLPVLQETLNQENAILLSPDEIAAWVSAIQELQSDACRRDKLARQARKDVQNYSWQSRAERILKGM
ncbi:MAG: glycosyltransferase family 4 protein [Anaerolineales bacterium]|nr:glycosyltransferase family 4 protein [Chloroflexota bacterium]MBL6980231.1 glycosyltransferase family 4 protein [Anaerolineales bacterium]